MDMSYFYSQQPSRSLARETRSPSHDADRIPSITEAYESSVRPVMDVIDSLRRMGLNHDVALPSITVIGDQSSGKSSVLEAISGVQLPRGKGIVTRCPIELRLRHIKEPGVWRASLTYQSGDTPKNRVINNKGSIESSIRQAQTDLAGNKGISKDMISLTIESSDVPDLTLVDLPGIARIAVGDQDPEIPTKIRDLIQDHIRGTSAIILVVVPANVDIALTEAFTWAKRFDPDGDRTLGVITKPDLVDAGTEQNVLDVVNNIVYPLKKGYTIVKCRGQMGIDNNTSLAAALSEEEDYFDNHNKYGEISRGQRGTKTLAIKLSEELKSHIKTCFPKLQEKIRSIKADTETQFRGMSLTIPETDTERAIYLLQIIHDYLEDFKSATHTLNSSLTKEYQLFKPAREDFKEFMGDLNKISPTEDDKAFREKIAKNIDKYTGRELPTFDTYEAFKETMKHQVKLCERPTLECSKKVYRKVNQVTTNLVKRHFGRFRGLAGHIQKIIQETQDNRRKTCDEKLKEHIDVEALIYSQDSTFLDELETIKKEFRQPHEGNLKLDVPIPMTSGLVNATIHSPVVDKLVKTTKNDPDSLDAQVDEMYKKLYSFMQVFRKRISDTVPMIIIYNLFDKMYEDVKTKLWSLTNQSQVVEMLQEDKNTQRQRNDLKNKLERLTKAENELDNINMDV